MKRRAVRKLIQDIRHSVENAVPHSLAFQPTGGMTEEEKKRLQDSLDHSFDIWRRTWIYPWLAMLESETGVDKLKR